MILFILINSQQIVSVRLNKKTNITYLAIDRITNVSCTNIEVDTITTKH